MASEMNWVIFGVFIFVIFVPIADCRMRVIFGARCEARCLAKTLSPRQTCNGSCYAACIKPCIDLENFNKVKSCKLYCWDIKVKHDNWQCRGSCKYLLKLYNTGIKSGLCQSNNDTLSCGSTSCDLDNECPYLEKCCEQTASCGKTCQKPSFNITGYPSTPTAVNSMFIKNPRSVSIEWLDVPRNPRSQSDKAVVFLVEVRHLSVGSKQGVVSGEWTYLNMTTERQLTAYPKSNTWSEYRVLAVKEQGTSEYSSQSSAIYIPPEKPTPPRNFRINTMAAVKSKVRVELVWNKPEKSDFPIHRYRVSWSRRLDSHTEELMSLRIHDKRITPDQHSAIINGLRFNTTYLFEIQAICRYNGGKRLRSQRVYITARTMEREKPAANKKVLHKKMEKVFRNSYKKPSKKEKTKPIKPDGTFPPPTKVTIASVAGRPENASKITPNMEANMQGTSRGNNIHACLFHILGLLLFPMLQW